jgi:hypothetical protein
MSIYFPTLRAVRPLGTTSFIFILFDDKLDGDTSIIPDPVLCSVS